MKRRYLVEFTLSMPYRPSTSSWGKERDYRVFRSIDYPTLAKLFPLGRSQKSWFYSWSDGWRARVDGRIMAQGERTKKTDGFCGYDWMVESLIRHGAIYAEGEAPAVAS